MAKLQSQGHDAKYFGTKRNVLSQKILMWNTEAIKVMVWPRLKFAHTPRKKGHNVNNFAVTQTNRETTHSMPANLRLHEHENVLSC